MKEIADRIRQVRLQRGMTQQDLADAVGLKDRSSIAKIETDTYEPGLDALKKIAKALNCDPDYLVFGDDSKEKMKEEINFLFDRLAPEQQDAVLQFLRSLTAGRK